MKGESYSSDEIEFMQDLRCRGYPWQEVTQRHNERFSENRTKEGLRRKFYQLSHEGRRPPLRIPLRPIQHQNNQNTLRPQSRIQHQNTIQHQGPVATPSESISDVSTPTSAIRTVAQSEDVGVGTAAHRSGQGAPQEPYRIIKLVPVPMNCQGGLYINEAGLVWCYVFCRVGIAANAPIWPSEYYTPSRLGVWFDWASLDLLDFCSKTALQQ